MFTTEQAREYFKPLTYDDISKSDWRQLIAILEKHIEIRNKQELDKKLKDGYSDYTYEISRCVWNKPNKRIGKSAYIHVKVDNYSEREGISFNPNGFIGFAGWASSYNVKLFIDAFIEWVDWKKGKKVEIPNIPTYVKDIFVDEFPQNPINGQIVLKDGCIYKYLDDWKKSYNPVDMLDKIKLLVQQSQDCQLKNDLLKIL